MIQACHLRRVAVAAALIAMQCVAHAQTDAENENKAGGFGGFLSNIGKSAGALFGSGADKSLIAGLTPGPYSPSNQAIGDERDVESQRLENYGFVPLKPYQDYANVLYTRLKELSGVTGVPGSIHLLATSELLAKSSPDGNVYLSIAWVNTITSEDELAALLAHELAHVLLHHHDSTIFSTAQKKLQYAFAVGSDLKNKLEKVNQVAGASLSSGQMKSLKRMQLLVEATDRVMLPAWTRSQETDADRLALDLLHKAGYAAAGMTDFLNDISSWDQKQAERRKQKESEIQAEMQELTSSGNLDAALKLGLDEGLAGIMSALESQHEGGERRLEESSAYREKHYPEWPRSAIRRDAYKKVLNDHAVKPVRDAYAATFSAIGHIERGNFDEAYKLLTPVTKTGAPGARHAMPQFELYRALDKLGRKEAAFGQLVRSYHAEEPSWKPYAEAIRYEARRGNRAQSLQIAKEARMRFKDAPALTPRLVEVYAETGLNEELQQELTACNAIHVTYRDQCQQLSKRK